MAARVCAWCHRILGFKRGVRDLDHTICPECEEREFGA